MSFKTQLNKNYWNDSKQLFFTPKLSLEGHHLFPQITDFTAFLPNREQPFLNILKKPIMSLYQRVQLRSQKKPVCIVGMPKEVQYRHVKTGGMRRTQKGCQNLTESNSLSQKEGLTQKDYLNNQKDSLSTYTPTLLKTQMQSNIRSTSKKCMPINLNNAEGIIYYFIGNGNNGELMDKILSRRQGWYPTTNSIFQFRWEQTRAKYQNMNPQQKQAFNHLPNHQAISDKGNLLENLRIYCQKSQEYMYRLVPVSFVLDFGNQDTIQNQIKKFVQFYWQCNNLPKNQDFNPENKTIQNQDRQKNQQKRDKNTSARRRNINCSSQFSVKVESPKKGSKKQNVKCVSIRSVRNKSQLNQCQYIRKRQEIKGLYKSLISKLKPIYNFQDMSPLKKDNPYATPLVSQVYGDTSMWLLKPSDLNRGRGIRLFHTVDELADQLKHELLKNEKGSFIIQKYLEKPLLIEDRKFDIRVWAMITQNRQVFYFKQGYIRMSSQKFTLDSNSLFTHLTNNAVQKHATNYGQFQQGNILPLSRIEESGLMTREQLNNQIKKQIIISMRAGGAKMHAPNQKKLTIQVNPSSTSPQKGNHSTQKTKYFQIFGYDFMVDCAKHVWLIEVNTNPCIELSNKWLSSIIPRMLDDAMKLTIDKIFYRKKCLKEDAESFSVEGYSNGQNMWQMLDMDLTDSLSTHF